MKIILSLLTGGIAGTAVMTGFLLLPRWMDWGKIDVVRAVGSLMTGRRERIFRLGLSLHVAMGILFAFLYAGFLNLSRIPFNAMTGLLLGSLHGVIIMLLVSIMVMEHHPVAGYHEKGLGTGLAQLVAHMLYGATVGWIVSIT
ncbi:MAG: hypothetical protein ORN23_07270 [Chthoniobacterales bacterium]|nr:hypothetical protein [Chthoniobacterales bacterium]